MLKTCLYCDHTYDTINAVRGVCPLCHYLEPKHIQGFVRSKHPLYGRWKHIIDHANVEIDETFKSFYLFTKWFNSKTQNFSDVVMRRKSEDGYTVDNCYVDINNYSGNRRRLFLKLSDTERASLKHLIQQGQSATKIGKVFGVSTKTAQTMVEDHKRHEQMLKYA